MRQLSISIAFILLITLTGCKSDRVIVVKIEMHLSNFGVESDDFPSVNAVIDLPKGTSVCKKTYDGPDHADLTYALNNSEINRLKTLLRDLDLKKLKSEYKIGRSDQPSSKAIFYTAKAKYIISDYGLQGEDPLQEIYKIVYKL